MTVEQATFLIDMMRPGAKLEVNGIVYMKVSSRQFDHMHGCLVNIDTGTIKHFSRFLEIEYK